MKGLFDNYGFESSGILNVSPREAFELMSKGALLIDVREEYLRSLKFFDVQSVSYFPKSKLIEEFEKLPSDRFMIFADTVGLRSKEVVIFLKERGYRNIANMAGGIVDWERDGLPVATDINVRLSGACVCKLKPREGDKGKST